MRPGAPAAGRGAPDRAGALHRVQQRARGVEVEGIAELVGLGRGGGLDAGRLLARVVPAEAALAERPEQIAQRAVAEEVERLVGDFELHGRLIGAGAAARAALALAFEVGRRGDIPLLAHALDDLLNQFLELGAGLFLIAVSRIAEQPLDRFVRQHATVEERIQNRVVQRLHGLVVFVGRVRVAEAAGQQQVGQLRDQILEVEVVEQVAGEFRVAVFHGSLSGLGAGGSGLKIGASRAFSSSPEPPAPSSRSVVILLLAASRDFHLFVGDRLFAAAAAGRRLGAGGVAAFVVAADLALGGEALEHEVDGRCQCRRRRVDRRLRRAWRARADPGRLWSPR